MASSIRGYNMRFGRLATEAVFAICRIFFFFPRGWGRIDLEAAVAVLNLAALMSVADETRNQHFPGNFSVVLWWGPSTGFPLGADAGGMVIAGGIIPFRKVQSTSTAFGDVARRPATARRVSGGHPPRNLLGKLSGISWLFAVNLAAADVFPLSKLLPWSSFNFHFWSSHFVCITWESVACPTTFTAVLGPSPLYLP